MNMPYYPLVSLIFSFINLYLCLNTLSFFFRVSRVATLLFFFFPELFFHFVPLLQCVLVTLILFQTLLNTSLVLKYNLLLSFRLLFHLFISITFLFFFQNISLLILLFYHFIQYVSSR